MCSSLLTTCKATMLIAIEFTSILLSHTPAASVGKSQLDVLTLRKNLLKALRDDHEQVIEEVIRVLLQLATIGNETEGVIRDILRVIHNTRGFLENRGSFVIRTLCKYESADIVFSCLACSLIEDDPEFNSLVVQLMEVILLTGEETVFLRKRLRGFAYWTHQKSETDSRLFDVLFHAFCCNSVYCLALCWFTEEYQIAERIVDTLSSHPLSMSFLLQADKLIKLLETPIFVHLRLHLVDRDNPTQKAMWRSICGFLMFLPQVGKTNCYDT